MQDMIQFGRDLVTFDQQVKDFVTSLKEGGAPILTTFDTLELATRHIVKRGIRTAEENKQALEVFVDLGEMEKAINSYWEPTTEASNKLHKALTTARGGMVKAVTELRAGLKQITERYRMDQIRAEREANAALARQAEQDRRRLEQEARDLASRGYMKEAREIAAVAEVTVAPTVAGPEPVPGIRETTTWTAEVVDFLAFLLAIADGKIPLEHLDRRDNLRPIVIVDQPVLNAVASRMGKTMKWPGVKVTEGVRQSGSGRM